MAIPVDGLVLEAQGLSANEAAMTGESDEIKKDTFQACYAKLEEKQLEDVVSKGTAEKKGAHDLPSPLLLSGTAIQAGEGRFLSIVCGDASAIGQIKKTLDVSQDATPLQKKLEKIANDVGLIGTYAALLTIHVLLARFLISGFMLRAIDLFGGEAGGELADYARIWLGYLIIGVAIIVVAVPEGLPLAVMISLAFSIGRMLDDKCDVKRLASCEIMGGADNICSDKTGTLTLNQMKVVRMWAGAEVKDGIPKEFLPLTAEQKREQETTDKIILPTMTKLDIQEYLQSEFQKLLPQAIVCNTAETAGATDKAMIELMERFSVDFNALKNKHLKEGQFTRFPFTSSRKRMSTIISDVGETQFGYDKRILLKGASEKILASCTSYVNAEGQVVPLTDEMKQKINNDVIVNYAKQALRTIGVAYKDLQAGDGGPNHQEEAEGPEGKQGIMKVEQGGFTLITIFGIQDIMREEVPGAIAQVGVAGVMVRMVTGDNLVTAKAIAKDCGIVNDQQMEDDEVCMEGPKFHDLVQGLSCSNCNQRVPFECECDKDDRKEVVTNVQAFK